MADGPYRFQQGTGPLNIFQHNQQNYHPRNIPQRSGSPINSAGKIGFGTDTPSPSRSPGPQSPAQNLYGMFNQSHGQQNQHVMVNGGTGRHFAMPVNMAKHFPHQGHQNQHQIPQHHDHVGPAHGGNFGGHQHTLSNSGLSSSTPHFAPSHLHNGTPSTANSGIAKASNEHWAEQLSLAQKAREMTMSHSYARSNPGVGKNLIVGNSSGPVKDSEKEERNRAAPEGNEDSPKKQVWTVLDLSGQNLKAISPPLFAYKFLTKLYMNCNKLTHVSPAIGQLRNLTLVDLSLNELRILPLELGMLSKLRQLLLFDNQLEVLPFELGFLHHLDMLGIEGNPLQEDLKSMIVEHGTSELIKYFRENAPWPDPPADRDWIEIDDTSPGDQDRFSILSFNTLCDIYATHTQFGYTPSTALSWDHRKELILEELRNREADVFCLQEINSESFHDFFRPALAHNDYKGMFFSRPRARTMGEKEARTVDGCAIFYKNSKYILLDKQLIDFSKIAINRPDMKGEHDIFNRVMPKDHIAVVAFFEHRMTGYRLIVANAHMHWDPHFRDVKIVQTAILMEQLARLADQYAKWAPCVDKELFRFANGGSQEQEESPEPAQVPEPSLEYTTGVQIPMVVCGDFNSTPNSGVYDLITRGNLPGTHPDFMDHKYGDFTKEGITHPFNLKSSYESMGDLAFTNYTPTFTGVIDYIWYSANALSVRGLLGDVDKRYLSRVPGFPNCHFPSDHLSILAEFTVKIKK